MRLRKSQTVLLALGIFLWAHFIPGIASPPWTNPDKSHLEGRFSFSTKYLGLDLKADLDLEAGMTLGKLEEELIAGNVRQWILLSTLFVLGIYSCWLIFMDSRYWTYLVFLLSGFISVYTIPPIIDLFNFSPTWAEHFAYVIGYIPRHSSSFGELLDAYLFVMYIYISPILFGGVFLYSINEIFGRIRKRKIAA